MKLLCCIVTHNRRDYTYRALQAWWYYTFPDDRLVIVDNASSDGTVEMLRSLTLGNDVVGNRPRVVLNERNLFPGAACNIGWHTGLKRFDADLLMRLDNDIELLPGWREEVERCFNRVDNLGQLGILNMHEDFDNQQPVTLDDIGTVNVHFPNVGGNCVIPRIAWDHGIRWSAGQWRPGGQDEDTVMSRTIREQGGLVAHVVPTIANNMSFHRYEDYPEYYDQTAALRGLVPQLSV